VRPRVDALVRKRDVIAPVGDLGALSSPSRSAYAGLYNRPFGQAAQVTPSNVATGPRPFGPKIVTAVRSKELLVSARSVAGWRLEARIGLVRCAATLNRSVAAGGNTRVLYAASEPSERTCSEASQEHARAR